MTGRVIKVNVSPGDSVNESDILLVIEAMKMENEIAAPMSGKIKEVAVAPAAASPKATSSSSSNPEDRVDADPAGRILANWLYVYAWTGTVLLQD